MLSNPYDFMFAESMRKLFKPGKPVRHQQTCPVCGRKLVNTYRRGNDWKCLKCWNAAEAEATNEPT